jgi:transcriptional regulator with XRE-family HTH domain
LHFERNLVALREQKGLSQEELGKLIGVSRESVSHWERGSKKPAMKSLQKLLELFDVTMEQLGASDMQFESGPGLISIPILEIPNLYDSRRPLLQQCREVEKIGMAKPEGADVGFLVSSDEHAPAIQKGDYILCRKTKKMEARKLCLFIDNEKPTLNWLPAGAEAAEIYEVVYRIGRI